MEYENRNQHLAILFTNWREIIESAETPFAKLGTFVLPIITPLVPASLTALHLYKMFYDITQNNTVSVVMSVLVGIVLELLGYVGAVAFISAIFNWLRNRNEKYLVPAILTFLSYGFYLTLMPLINVALGRFYGEESLITWIVGFLSFLTVPTGLLSANNLAMKEDKEIKLDEKALQERRYQEARADKLEKYKIKHGARTFQKVSESFPNPRGESTYFSQILPNHWKRVRPLLSTEDVERIAHWTQNDIRVVAQEQGKEERTLINWRTYCRIELGLLKDE